MNSFSYVVALVLEVGVAGMSWGAHFQARLVAILVNTMTAGPFGSYRTMLFSKMEIDPNQLSVRSYLVDSIAFASFQLPIYCVNLWLAGTSFSEGLIASLSLLAVAGIMGGPYGRFLTFVYRMFRVDVQSEE